MSTPQQQQAAKSWRRHARKNFGLLLIVIANFWWMIRHTPAYPRSFLIALIAVNTFTLVTVTSSIFLALKWYRAYLDGGERLREQIERLFR